MDNIVMTMKTGTFYFGIKLKFIRFPKDGDRSIGVYAPYIYIAGMQR